MHYALTLWPQASIFYFNDHMINWYTAKYYSNILPSQKKKKISFVSPGLAPTDRGCQNRKKTTASAAFAKETFATAQL